MMSETKSYEGGCHCGAVRYEVTTNLTPLIACNCSNCQIKGLTLTFVDPTQFKLTSSEDALRDYQFNKNVIHHLFCATCGVESFAHGRKPDGSEAVAINVRCLDGIDFGALKPTPVDGRSR
jgi:hypothetical protein